MLRRVPVIASPDGRHWKVRRRWADRPLPNLRERFRRGRKEVDGEALLDGWLILDGSSGLGAIGIAVGVGFLILILLPLLGIALELAVLLLVLVYGLFARIALRRPWIVEAIPVGDPEDRVVFAVEGWRDSSTALRELRATIAASGPPDRLTVGRRLATRPGVS